MTPGSIARRVLGPRLFPLVGRGYRRLFVDLRAVVRHLPVPVDRPASVLDVGGGDGALLDLLLAAHPRLRATLLDTSPSVGAALRPAHAARVTLRPGATAGALAAQRPPDFDLVLLADVVHHVPVAERAAFFAELAPLVAPATTLAVKDVRPGSLRATAGLYADRYVSGDRSVCLASEEEIEALVRAAIPDARAEHTALHAEDAPNYCVVFRRGEAAPGA